MDLKGFLAIVWGKKWVILTTTLVTVAVVAAFTLLTRPVYTATTTLRVATAVGGSVTYSDYMYADRLLNTYVKIATSGPILNELVDKLSLAERPQIKVAIVPNTELIQISVDSTDPGVAQLAANTLAEMLIAQGKELYSGSSKSPLNILNDQLVLAEAELKQARQNYEELVTQSPNKTEEIEAANRMITLKENTYETVMNQYEQARLSDALKANTITVIDLATRPLSPSRPRTLINIGIGLLVGLCGGLGLAFLIENLNGHLYSSEEIESITGIPVLTKIPNVKRESLLLSKNSNHPPDLSLYEAFYRLRTNIQKQYMDDAGDASTHSFLITSAEPGEGKTTVATHLAMVMGQSELEVLLVDADMRLPSLHKFFDLPNSFGLSNILKREANWEDVIQNCHIPGVKVITSGPRPDNPSELLGSPFTHTLIEELTNRYQIVIIDAPAFLPVTDAAALAPMMDSVMLVVRRKIIQKKAIQDVCKQLENIQVRPIGIIVNGAEHSGSYYYYHKR